MVKEMLKRMETVAKKGGLMYKVTKFFSAVRLAILLLVMIPGFVISTSASADNVALNKPVTADSVFDPVVYAAAKANDGNPTTRWASVSGALDYSFEWEVDLERLYKISRIRIRWEAASSINYEVLTSIDRVNYTELFQVSGLTQGADRTDDWSFATTDGIRFVKFRNITQWAGIVSMYEFEVYGVPADSNLEPVEAHTSADNEGDTATKWVSAVSGKGILPEVRVVFKKEYTPGELGGANIYLPKEPVRLIMKIKNKKEKELSAEFEYKIKDFFGNLIKEDKLIMKVNPNTETPKEATFTPDKNGVYYLSYTLKDTEKEGVIREGKVSFSVIPEGAESKIRPEDSPFGIVMVIPDMALIAGIRWVRADTYWHIIEPEKGVFNWNNLDNVVNEAQKYHLEVMPIISYSTTWASTGPKDDPKAIFYPPDLKEWERHVTDIVGRYKGKVKYWEIWNEPDGEPVFFINGSPEKYAELLKIAYIAAKKADPDCKIVGGAVAGFNYPYLDKVFKAGGFEYLDIVSIHPYRVGQKSPEESDFIGEVQKTKKIIDEYGGGKPIWLTEFGYQADDLNPKSKEAMDKGIIISEGQQANYLVRMYVQALSMEYVKKLFWFTLRHPNADNIFADGGSGWIRGDYTVKPSFVAHRTLVDMLEGAEPVSRQVFEDTETYVFKRNEKKITVVWSKNDENIVVIDANKEKIIVTDIMHNSREISSQKPSILFKVTESPVFIEGDNIKIAGEIFRLKQSDKIISRKAPQSCEMSINNITDANISGEIKIVHSDFNVEPEAKTFSVNIKESTAINFKINVKDPDITGNKKVSFLINLEDGTKVSKGVDFSIVLPESILVDNLEKDTMSLWTTNIYEKHVQFNEVKKTSEMAQEGKNSLHWKCKSNAWNNLNRSLSDINTIGVKQMEFWVYLPKPPAGMKNIAIELVDGNNNRFGYWGKMQLNETGKWVQYIFDIKDLLVHVGNPDAKLDLSKNFNSLTFNYHGGELEAYIDNLQFRR